MFIMVKCRVEDIKGNYFFGGFISGGEFFVSGGFVEVVDGGFGVVVGLFVYFIFFILNVIFYFLSVKRGCCGLWWFRL